jgi:hypothetical protein
MMRDIRSCILMPRSTGIERGSVARLPGPVGRDSAGKRLNSPVVPRSVDGSWTPR